MTELHPCRVDKFRLRTVVPTDAIIRTAMVIPKQEATVRKNHRCSELSRWILCQGFALNYSRRVTIDFSRLHTTSSVPDVYFVLTLYLCEPCTTAVG